MDPDELKNNPDNSSEPKPEFSSSPLPPNPFTKLIQRLGSLLKSINLSGLKNIDFKNPQTRKKVIVVAVVLLALFAGKQFLATMHHAKKAKPEQEAGEQVVAVKAFKVGKFNYEDSLNVLGTIKGGIEFKLSFEIPGVVSAVNYREGERYEEGALLISLKQDDILLRLKRVQAERSKADTAVQIAEEKLKEHEKLFQIGAIPQTTLDKVKLEVDSAKYDLQAAALEVKANEVILEKSNLYAPTAGTIGELNVEEGEAVSQNTLIGTHLSTDRVVAEFGVTERDLNKLSLGQKARVFVDAYPDKTFEGTIEGIGSAVVGQSRTANVKVRIENSDNLLVPGMFARIKILLFQKKNTLVIPTDSLQGKENEHSIFVIDPETKQVHAQPVVIGYQRTDYAQIDAGAREGDLIAITGLDRLKENSKVRVIETQEAEL